MEAPYDTPAPHPGADNNKTDSPAIQLTTSVMHQGITALGFAFLIFELFFLVLYTNSFWFSIDLTNLGVLGTGVALLVAHLLLTFLESDEGCRFFSPVWKGSPPICYRKWLRVADDGIKYGIRYLQWPAIDQLELTFWGNILVKSRSLCGSAVAEPDVVLRFPFGVAKPSHRTEFAKRLKQARAEVVLNQRMQRRLAVVEMRGTEYAQMLGVLLMFLVLLDVGYSTCRYLEILKGYHLCRVAVREGKPREAARWLARADAIKDRPLVISWVTSKLFASGGAASGLHQERSNALFALDRKREAVAEMRLALKAQPTSARIRLHLARMLIDTGSVQEARQEIGELIEDRGDMLLPQLYLMALAREGKDPTEAWRCYKSMLDEFEEDEVFDQEPFWPPGGERYLRDPFYPQDIRFIFDRLIGRGQ